MNGSAIPRAVQQPKPWSPDDVSALHELAAALGGRPIPGLWLTAEQFIDWCDPEAKAEWIDGEVTLMSPEGWESVNFITWLSSVLRQFVEERDLGALLGREMLVRLPHQRRLRAPDIQFISKERFGIITQTVVEGAPDLVIESVSPTSISRDWRTKHSEYEKAGIREYWVFDPLSKYVEAYALGKSKRYAAIPELDGKITSAVLRGFHFRPKWLAAAKLPSVAATLRDLGLKG